MSDRAEQLYTTANSQIEQLVALLSRIDDTTLRRPAPGRDKLGDGTIGALVAHTADNYQRIAEFVQASDRMSATHGAAQQGGHRVPRFARALGHRPPEHTGHDAGTAGGHDEQYTAENVNLADLLQQLTNSRDNPRRIAELTESQLDAIPPTAASASATDNAP
jgi:hypothetical protein